MALDPAEEALIDSLAAGEVFTAVNNVFTVYVLSEVNVIVIVVWCRRVQVSTLKDDVPENVVAIPAAIDKDAADSVEFIVTVVGVDVPILIAFHVMPLVLSIIDTDVFNVEPVVTTVPDVKVIVPTL